MASREDASRRGFPATPARGSRRAAGSQWAGAPGIGTGGVGVRNKPVDRPPEGSAASRRLV